MNKLIYKVNTTAGELHKSTSLDREVYERLQEVRITHYVDYGRLIASITGDYNYIEMASDLYEQIDDNCSPSQFLDKLISLAK